MAVTYGFFNSVNGDRKYNADQMSEYFSGIINEGVFQHLNGGLAVTAGTGLAVNVASGRAIVQNKWVQNDASLALTIDAASETYARKDAVVVRLDNSSRAISIVVKKGTPAATPEAPSMTRTSTTYEICLAYVNVAAAATSVTITDKRSDSTVCGWVTVAQATSGEVDAQLNALKTGFDGVVYSSPAAMVQGEDQKLQDQITEIGQFKVSGTVSGTWRVDFPFISGKSYTVVLNLSANSSLNTYQDSTTIDSLGTKGKNDTVTFTASGNANKIGGYTGGSGTISIKLNGTKIDTLNGQIDTINDTLGQNNYNYSKLIEYLPYKGTFVRGGEAAGQVYPAQTYRIMNDEIVSYPDRTILTVVKDGYRFCVARFDSEGTYVSTSGWIYGSTVMLPNEKFKISIAKVTETPSIPADIVEFSQAVMVNSVAEILHQHDILSPFNKPFMGSSRIKIASHRGWHDETTIFQNTVKAFEAAGVRKSWGIETDIRETTDHHFVLMHDDDVSTTTDGTGNVSSMTYSQIEALKITNDPTQHVPTLEEYLGICKTYGCVPFMEIKGIQSAETSVANILNIVKSFGLLENCVIIAAAYIIGYVRSVSEDVTCVTVIDSGHSYATMKSQLQTYRNVGYSFDAWSGNLTAENVADSHANGRLAGMWTTESVEDAKTYFNMGVDFITSDTLTSEDFYS